MHSQSLAQQVESVGRWTSHISNVNIGGLRRRQSSSAMAVVIRRMTNER
jgi:hypothetical protein